MPATGHELQFEHVLAELTTDLLLVIDPDGTLRYANRAALRILGREPNEYLGDNVLDLVHPDDLVLASRALEASGASRVPTSSLAGSST